ncbi:DNA-binding NarL/FixJ family response regulator [Nocardioides thalensis]|uniref:DNA-binding NarL/FixJ family response regulator n=1 Tax=Nocardioides thalensis TaxID=1914755 RepID=A0A853BXN3_9ACTN|nr:response regulator transcription factor [Nocardioides thalensis]NYI99884.1 DNA-binding NarL/FixJ family response regulator [Nocardioides thalensis]
MTPRVLIADDHPVYRDGLRMMLASTGAVDVVGTAADGREAVARTAELRPDVVVMDVQMPGLDGIEATRQIVAVGDPPAVLVLTMHEDEESVFAAMLAGARGYLVKGADQDDILRAIAAVANGEVIFGPALAARVTRHFAELATGRRPGVVFPELTTREHEVLDLIAAGMSNGEIAARLYLAPKTVRNNVSNVFAKLQVADRAEAIVRARDAGLGRGQRR